MLQPVQAGAAGYVGPDATPASAAVAAPAEVSIEETEVPPVEEPAPEPEAAQGGGPEALQETEPQADEAPTAVELEPTDVAAFGLVGVTWDPDPELAGVSVEVRTRSGGQWSDWQALETDDPSGAVDPAAADPAADGEQAAGRPGTEGHWIGEADGVAARVTADAGTLENVQITTIDGGEAPAAPADAAAPALGPVGDGSVEALQTSKRPTIISRSAWGATGGSSCASPVYGSSTLGAVIHHTAGSNTYTKAESASIVRATQAYHTKSRSWCDIGYNFLVDKYGQIFEGRKGGVDRQVRAAHSGNGPVNERTVGISMMGTYTSVDPSAATKNAVADLVAWRFAAAKLKATGTYSLGGKNLQRIDGHRNVVATACPGTRGWAWVNGTGSSNLRGQVSTRLSGTSTPSPAPAAPAPKPTTANSKHFLNVPSNGSIKLTGRGYGHGIGMSQYGAQNAATQGRSAAQILSYYYPGTTLGTRTGNMRVRLSDAHVNAVRVRPRSGLVLRAGLSATSKRVNLPAKDSAGATITAYRILAITNRPAESKLQAYRNGRWSSYNGVKWTGTGQFEAPGPIRFMSTKGERQYRGAIRAALSKGAHRERMTVNVLKLDWYVRGVVAAEMPSSWRPAALQAQSIAARTYGERYRGKGGHFDICDTTSCQVYRGRSAETANTDAAVRGTSGRIVQYQGKPALTQFSSSSGGRSAKGSEPYLVDKTDQYDNWSGNPNHEWNITVKASTLEKKYPKVGTLRTLSIKRSGAGSWGGRVETLELVGSKGKQTITGNDARWTLGLKSNWFMFG